MEGEDQRSVEVKTPTTLTWNDSISGETRFHLHPLVSLPQAKTHWSEIKLFSTDVSLQLTKINSIQIQKATEFLPVVFFFFQNLTLSSTCFIYISLYIYLRLPASAHSITAYNVLYIPLLFDIVLCYSSSYLGTQRRRSFYRVFGGEQTIVHKFIPNAETSEQLIVYSGARKKDIQWHL